MCSVGGRGVCEKLKRCRPHKTAWFFSLTVRRKHVREPFPRLKDLRRDGVEAAAAEEEEEEEGEVGDVAAMRMAACMGGSGLVTSSRAVAKSNESDRLRKTMAGFAAAFCSVLLPLLGLFLLFDHPLVLAQAAGTVPVPSALTRWSPSGLAAADYFGSGCAGIGDLDGLLSFAFLCFLIPRPFSDPFFCH
jgi:hypothetical protein